MRSLLLRVFLVKKRVGGWVGGSAPWPPCCPHPGTPSLSPPGRGREMARGRGDGCWLRGYRGEWGDGCCGRGYFCDWGVVGAVREPPLRVGRRERGWLLR